MWSLSSIIIKYKGRISSEKYWCYFHCPNNGLRSISNFVFWIFPASDTAVQLESADSKQNAISKSLIQDSFPHIFWAMSKMHHTFWKKATFKICSMQSEFWSCLNMWPQSAKLRQEVSKNSLFSEFLYLFYRWLTKEPSKPRVRFVVCQKHSYLKTCT